MLGFANINLYGSSDYSQVEFNVHRRRYRISGCARR
ncbi:oligopeptide ABC transporter [Klebsiella pneumoniae]|uniref:Oligopeptide ABC transporter n=1 Tax=Klebsiella pneumoniae TaxID=573 RepID=A0A2X3EDT0_KLEPN|nr:oligopeptide ABC transporter [Klebsiella pneumoniae]